MFSLIKFLDCAFLLSVLDMNIHLKAFTTLFTDMPNIREIIAVAIPIIIKLRKVKFCVRIAKKVKYANRIGG